jgi:uncharacterized protein (TIGR02452 family)
MMSLKDLAQEVLIIARQGWYESQGTTVDFHAEQRFAEQNTRLYTPSQLDDLRYKPTEGQSVPVEVVEGTSQTIAQQLSREASHRDSPIGLLNFASARSPGGGFLNGAKAQEEDLCRCSGLYPCLLMCMKYFDVNRNQESMLYTDYSIFSPNVPFFKVRSTGDFLQTPIPISVITAPAPNTVRYMERKGSDESELRDTFLRRWENVLCIAREEGIKRLLLGAWGCGAFGGDPVLVSQTAKEAIREYGKGFEKIVFAIPDTKGVSRVNFDTFRETFARSR